ncbi:hypothetical protein HMN09_00388000 [Mycena chlorophos]|uniref:Uncharacterized protein n=1 Tax=Mycena chlorophos TaxID=658473 RepID=A0A8H6TLA2_MYCCL|nr:hypothetical protein HMN09_00388000 [Mycena chlorophos]
MYKERATNSFASSSFPPSHCYAMTHSDVSGEFEKGHNSRFGSSAATERTTRRLTWPFFIVTGQVAILIGVFTLLSSVHARGQLVEQSMAKLFQGNPQLKSFTFSLIATWISIFSSYLFTQAIRHALLVALTRPTSLSTLSHGMALAKESLIIQNRHYKWVLMSIVIFGLSLGQTPGLTSFLTPNDIDFVVPVSGREFDLTSPALQNVTRTLIASGPVLSFLDSSLISLIDASGQASATSKSGYPMNIGFSGYTHNTTTRGILPLAFVDAANVSSSAPFSLSNTSPLPPDTPISELTLAVTQQGLRANVSCTETALGENSNPQVLLTNSTTDDGLTQWNASTPCSGTPSSSSQYTSTGALGVLFMLGCREAVSSGPFLLAVYGQGDYNAFSHVCTIDVQIQSMIANYSGAALSLLSTEVDPSSAPVDASALAVAATAAMEIGNGQTQPLDTLLEAYLQGVVEFTGTAVLTGFLSDNTSLGLGSNPAADSDMLHTVTGTAVLKTLGYEYKGFTTFAVLIPTLLIAVISIGVVIAAQIQIHNNGPGMPLSVARFDPNEPLLMMAAASAGGLTGMFHGIEDADVEKGWGTKIMLGQVNGRHGFVQV